MNTPTTSPTTTPTTSTPPATTTSAAATATLPPSGPPLSPASTGPQTITVEPGGGPTEVPDALGVLVRAHPALCEGWGNCHRFAAAVYPLDAEGYVDLHLLDVPPELAALARLGADVCPARAITVITRPPAGQR